jgi:hypothetical protein
MSEHSTKKKKVNEKVTLSKREELKKQRKKQKDARGGIYIYIKVYRMRCVSVSINDDTGPVASARASGRIVVCVTSLLRSP